MHRQTQYGVGRGNQGGDPPLPLGGPPLLVLLPGDDGGHLVTGRGLSGGGDYLDQPPGSFYALLRVGNTCYT